MHSIIRYRKRGIFCLAFHFIIISAIGQVYLEKQSRHRFAQLNIGLDYQVSLGGSTQFFNTEGTLENLSFSSLGRPRILIGGTHFWGHADFYISIPLLYPTLNENNQGILFSSGVETVFKYYPWRIERRKLRPYIGFALTPFFYSQDNNNFNFRKGPDKTHSTIPLLAGFTYQLKNHLLELGVNFNYSNSIEYYISKTEIAKVNTPPLYLSLSYRYLLETTLSAEKDWESGRTAEVTKRLAERGKLNNFFVGVGMSSAWWLGNSSYNISERPYIGNYGISLMPDFTIGYYRHQPDLSIALNYRAYQAVSNVYGTIQRAKRKSIGLELTKYIGDYHGFAPFIGPIISYEKLSFTENFENKEMLNTEKNTISYGITFGWDIRPNRIQSFILRTNLRYFPNLKLGIEGDKSINFNNIEFNFIQLVLFPGRF